MKYTVCITQQCNLVCKYCYIGKKRARIPISVAQKIIDFAFSNTPPEEPIDIGFFGGEPLLEFRLIKEITHMIEAHPSFDKERVRLAVATNGTILTEQMISFFGEHSMEFCVSCDGPPFVQDVFRCFPSGRGSSEVVERTIKRAMAVFPAMLVNAVYHPRTFRYLPQVVEYLSSLGLRQIYLNPDFTATWTKEDTDLLPEVYRQVADLYVNYYLQQDPHFISLIDSKIALILRGGYQPLERCRMGRGEFAFTPSGNIYPCERLIGADSGMDHCIGKVGIGLDLRGLSSKISRDRKINSECRSCGIKDYCMNWCGCSNYFSTGYYNRVSPFLCASERAATQTAFNAFQILERKLGPTFVHHVSGTPALNSWNRKWR